MTCLQTSNFNKKRQNSPHLFRKGNNDIETAILFLPLPKLCQSGEVLFKKIKTFNRKIYQSINVTFFIWRTWLLSFCGQSSWWWSHNWLFYHFRVLSFVSLFFLILCFPYWTYAIQISLNLIIILISNIFQLIISWQQK